MKTRNLLFTAAAVFASFALGLTGCKDNDKLTVSPNYITIEVGEEIQVTASYGGSAVDASSVTWTSNDESVFSISNGLVKGLKNGQSTFTATYNDQTVTGDVVVEANAPTGPIVTPVSGGITVVIYIPEGSDCNGAPLWGGDTNPTAWNGEEMTAVENEDGWYKLDINAATAQGKPLAHPEGWSEATGLGNWPTQIGEYEVLGETTAEWTRGDNFEISSEGLLYIWVKSWQENPCASYSDYTITFQLPSCTDTEEIYITGTHDNWGFASEPVAVVTAEDGTKTATVTINGQDTFEWKPFSKSGDWNSGPVYCDDETGEVKAQGNYTLADASNGTIVIEGWENSECLPSCQAAEEGFRVAAYAAVDGILPDGILVDSG